MSVLPTGIIWYTSTFPTPIRDEGKPRPYNIWRFGEPVPMLALPYK
ncbi:MAG: hypothetical protein LBQ66_08715 [Planctomycetaceae bacterium]|nr:hypothetical protein [Planctomycetaceae bacterium]